MFLILVDFGPTLKMFNYVYMLILVLNLFLQGSGLFVLIVK